jgi:dihydropteroate synthase
MAHNVLVLGAVRPGTPGERLDLGLPRAESGDACLWVRLEGLGHSGAADLAKAMRRAGGSATPAPARRHETALARLGAPAPGAALVLAGTAGAFSRLSGSRRVPDCVTAEIASAIDAAFGPRPSLTLRDGRRAPADRTLIMGVLNVTPDSFSDGGRHARPRAAVRHALRLAEEGADIIDVGGESTRPGARPVGLAEESRRVLPVLEALVPALRRIPGGGPLLSIDTTKAEVARRAAALGADLINDISAMTLDPAMPAVAAEYRLPVVLQHLRGRPATMQRAPRYRLLLPEIAAFLRAAAARAVAAGCDPERLIVDPGFGFGKRRRHNLALLRRLAVFTSLGRPVLAGLSRKSFLAHAGEVTPAERLGASIASEALALAGGAAIIRAHDVREAARAARLCDAVLRGPFVSG